MHVHIFKTSVLKIDMLNNHISIKRNQFTDIITTVPHGNRTARNNPKKTFLKTDVVTTDDVMMMS